MITREQFENSYIINDHGELRDKYLSFAQEGAGLHKALTIEVPILFVAPTGEVEDWSNVDRFLNSEFFEENKPKQLTLADFEEEQKEKEEMIKQKEDLLGKKVRYQGESQWEIIKKVCELSGIEHGTWSGCDHFTGNTVAFISHSGVSELNSKVISSQEKYWECDEETSTEFRNLTEIPFSGFENYLNSSKVTPQYKYTPIEVESVFDLKEMFESGEIYFRWLGNEVEGSGGVGYDKITTENMLICRYEEGRLLKRERLSWQDVAQEFIKSDPVLSRDKFVEDMFGNEFKDYHEPLKQLAKLIVENTK